MIEGQGSQHSVEEPPMHCGEGGRESGGGGGGVGLFCNNLKNRLIMNLCVFSVGEVQFIIQVIIIYGKNNNNRSNQ